MTAPRRVAVIGGGWAGMACALRLSARPGLQVFLLEAAPHFGGRARGLDWHLDDGRVLRIDNGQHLTIGAYSETFAMLREAGAPPWDGRPLRWCGVGVDGARDQDWQIPDTGWPWRALLGAVPGCGPRGWPLSWRLHMARTLGRLVANGWQPPHPDLTAGAWLAEHRTPEALIAHFWRPLTEGALNTPLEQADAAVLVQVLRDSLGGPRDATRVLTPASDLDRDGVEPLCAALTRAGVALTPGTRVTTIDTRDGGALCLHLQQHGRAATMTVDHAVMALPFEASRRVWRDSGLPETQASRRWSQLKPSAITTIWIAINDSCAQRLRQLPDWAVFNPQPQLPHLAQVMVQRPGLLALVISAQMPDTDAPGDTLPGGHDVPSRTDAPGAGDRVQLARLLAQQLDRQLGIDIRSLPQRWIRERQATWACVPGLPEAGDSARRGESGVPRIWRCADDLEAGYPATIESAVRSGRRTATHLLERILQT